MAKRKKSKKAPVTKGAPAKKAKKKAPAKQSRLSRLKELASTNTVEGTESFLFDPEKLWSKVSGYVSTGSVAMDAVLGHGGIPMGRVVEIFGLEGSGKSTVAHGLLAEAQKKGGIGILADVENAIDAKYMTKIGVNLDELVMVQADTVETVFASLAEKAIKARELFPNGEPIVCVWDSLANTGTKAEIEAGDADKFRAEAAKVIRQKYRQHGPTFGRTQVCFVVINHLYRLIGGKNKYDVEYETYGGGGTKQWATQRIELKVVAKLWARGWSRENYSPPVGQIVQMRTIKNKVAPPFRSRNFAIRFGEGFDNVYSLWNDLQRTGVVQQSKSWFKLNPELFPDTKAWQGGHWGLVDLVYQQPDLFGKLIELYQEVPL